MNNIFEIVTPKNLGFDINIAAQSGVPLGYGQNSFGRSEFGKMGDMKVKEGQMQTI